jgi:acyl-[acyl-carrier-protein]-phospholipid O-acyltransferase/long-chain-fatty-acid--[acyl-carrier-protein] ligase
MFVTLFLFGVIATLFGPIKYGILPDHLKKEELPPATRWSKARPSWRSCSAHRGRLAAKEGNHPAMFGALIMVFALLCWGASLMIPRTGQGAPDLHVDPNIARSTGALLKTCGTITGCGGAGW